MSDQTTSPVETLQVVDPPFRLFRRNHKREDGVSASSQIGKAAEHMACVELLLQGWNAFLADAGLPYDVLVDLGGGRMCRIQVKGTTRMYERKIGPGSAYRSTHPHYRFPLRRSRICVRPITLEVCDVLALVALDRHLVAWLPVESIRLPSGKVKMLIEMKTRQMVYVRQGPRGTQPAKAGKFMEDYGVFLPPGFETNQKAGLPGCGE